MREGEEGKKAPATLCWRVARAHDAGQVTVLSDGEETRSSLYVDDCVEGIPRLMRCDFPAPLNLGTDRLVTSNELVDIIADAAGKEIWKEQDRSKPQGVRGRNAETSRRRDVLDWEPEVTLEEGMARTYWPSRGGGAGGRAESAGGGVTRVRTAALGARLSV